MPATGLVEELDAYVARAVTRAGGDTRAVRPGHRRAFVWPPHPVSYEFHVHPSDFTGRATFEAHGETFDVAVARTPYGVFGRCDRLWYEARGSDEEDMLHHLRQGAEPLLRRQRVINETLERPGRYEGAIRDLSRGDLVKLLYCADRDVAAAARVEIEKFASDRLWLAPLLFILQDRRHPHRRSAQWCVLDLFEAFPSFLNVPELELEVVETVRDLMWDAEDDYARTIYKAGVVLGGHLPSHYGGDALLECLDAPSRIGRRSAIHGLYHIAEWFPARMEEVVDALRQHTETDPEPLLCRYAAAMAADIEAAEADHVAEPTFEDEER